MESRAERSIRRDQPLAALEACDYQWRMASEDVLELTDSNFDAQIVNSDLPSVIDFWAAWCGPCKQLVPSFNELAQEYKGTANIGKLNVDEHIGVPQKYGVRSLPTILFFKGGNVVGQIVGAVPKTKIEQELKKHL